MFFAFDPPLRQQELASTTVVRAVKNWEGLVGIILHMFVLGRTWAAMGRGLRRFIGVKHSGTDLAFDVAKGKWCVMAAKADRATA